MAQSAVKDQTVYLGAAQISSKPGNLSKSIKNRFDELDFAIRTGNHDKLTLEDLEGSPDSNRRRTASCILLKEATTKPRKIKTSLINGFRIILSVTLTAWEFNQWRFMRITEKF